MRRPPNNRDRRPNYSGAPDWGKYDWDENAWDHQNQRSQDRQNEEYQREDAVGEVPMSACSFHANLFKSTAAVVVIVG